MSTATELMRLVVHEITAYGQVTYKTLEQIENFLASEPEAEPEAEPVAWINIDRGNITMDPYRAECWKGEGKNIEPLYLHPPKPEPARKPMTDEEMEKQYEIDKEYFGESVMRAFYNGVRFAEKHHGISGENQ